MERPSLFWPRTGVTRGTPEEAMILVLGIRSGGSSAASVCPGVSADSVRMAGERRDLGRPPLGGKVIGKRQMGASSKPVLQQPGAVLSPHVGSKSTGQGAAGGLAVKRGERGVLL